MNRSNEIYNQRINEVINYVNNNLDRSIPLDELASVALFSPYHFHRIFVAVTGESVNNFTSRMRLEKAARLLKFSQEPISDIAYKCGYSSTATLSRAFKQYFGLSPSLYRKNGEIENSKIRKDLFQVSQYHYDMNESELRNTFPVEIKEFPQKRIAYIRVQNSYAEGVVLNAFDQLIKWAKQVDLFDSEEIFGMSKDDPMVTPKEKCNYDVCITLPEEFAISPDNYMDTKIMPKCKYAVTTVDGDFNLAATAINYLFNHWLINSSYEPEFQAGLEIFKDKENICDWSYLHLDICIPIRNIKTL